MTQASGVALGSSCSFTFIASTVTPAATATIVSVEQAFTITGQPVALLPTDVIAISPPAASGVSLGITGVRANATGQLCITFSNTTVGSLTYPATAFAVRVDRA